MFEISDPGGGAATEERCFQPGSPLQVMPLPFDGWDRRRPWRRTVTLEAFRSGQRAAPASIAESVPEEGTVLVDDDPLPPGAVEPPEVVAAWLARQDELIESWRAGLSPQDRFEHEFSMPATPEALAGYTSVSQEQAAYRQDLAVQAHRVRVIADARRVAALLDAHAASIVDLTTRFGTTTGSADGLGGRAFATTIALLTGSDPRHVTHEVRVGTMLRDRLPQTWAVFQSGAASWTRVQKAVAQADGLDDDHWPAYDATAAELVVTSTRLKADLRRQRERLQDGTAAKRARTTFERRHTTVELGPDSGVAFVVEGLASDWIPRNDALHKLAVAAHGTDPLGRTVAQLRHDITLRVIDLGLEAFQVSAADGNEVVPARTKVDVQLTLTIPALAWLGHTTEPATLAGYGPIAMELAKDLAGSAKSFIRVLTHPITGVRLTMDRTVYTPPTDLARWVRIRDGRTRFPGTSTPAHLADIDHARGWRDGGPTNDDNLITLDRPSHVAKTAGLYEHELLDTGIVGLTDAWDHYFEDPPNDPVDPAPPGLLPQPDGSDEPCPF